MEFILYSNRVKIVEERKAFVAAPAFDMRREGGIDIEQFLPRIWMADHQRVHRMGLEFPAFQISSLIRIAEEALRPVNMVCGVHRTQSFQRRLQPV